MIPNLAEKEVWFLTGSQNLYGEETLRQVAEQSQEIARALEAASDISVTIVWKPVLKDSASIKRMALDVNSADNVIGVIAWMHTFSPAKMWIAGLDALRKPLLHLHTQANLALPWSEIDFDFMNLNQAAHGDREFGYIQSRLGIARKTVVGHVSNPAVVSSIATWSRAAAGWDASKNMKLARFGDNMRYVAVTEGDKTEAELRFGVQVNTWGVNELADAVHAASDADIDALVAEYELTYDVAPELRVGGERHESLRYGAAIELGLRSFLEAGGFSAFTTSFEDLGALRQHQHHADFAVAIGGARCRFQALRHRFERRAIAEEHAQALVQIGGGGIERFGRLDAGADFVTLHFRRQHKQHRRARLQQVAV
ncbi:MAG: hypothetical protein Q8K56_00895, partial [Rhodoglobus sp.]|nr:hypothetical protein [Rhodoglobus sp.]